MGNLCSMIDVNDHQEPQQRLEGVVYVNERQHQPYPAERLNMQLPNSSDQKRSSHSSSPDRRAMNGNQQQPGTPQQGEARPETPQEEQWRIATSNAAVEDTQAMYDGEEEQLPPQEEPFSWTKVRVLCACWTLHAVSHCVSLLQQMAQQKALVASIVLTACTCTRR